MTIDLPLSEFTQAQKLDLMETIWDDLSRDEKRLESPVWHESILQNRAKSLVEGTAKVSDWPQARDRIKHHVSCK